MEWKRFANKYRMNWTEDPVYSHFSTSERIVGMYDDEACIVEVVVRMHADQTPHSRERGHPDYWGWMDKGENDMVMIQPTWCSFDAQFAYGVGADEERGNGKAYRLTVEETRVVKESKIGNVCG